MHLYTSDTTNLVLYDNNIDFVICIIARENNHPLKAD